MAITDNKSLLLIGNFGGHSVGSTSAGYQYSFFIDTGIYRWETDSGLTFVPRILFASVGTPVSIGMLNISESTTGDAGSYMSVSEKRLTSDYKSYSNVYSGDPLSPFTYLTGTGVIDRLERYIQITIVINEAVSTAVYYAVDAVISPPVLPVNVDYYNTPVTPASPGTFKRVDTHGS